MDIDTLKYLINHIFLPLRLPQSEDQDIDNDLAICDRVMACGRNFQQLLPARRTSAWDLILMMIKRLRDLLSTGALNENKLVDRMKDLKPGDVLVIPIRTQNACVIIRKVVGHVIFESFEVTPPNAAIIGTVGRLIRCFPETAIRVPDETAMDPLFQRELIIFLVNIDVKLEGSVRLPSLYEREKRDTCDPHYITQLLTAILRGQKGSLPVNELLIEKHTRYEVLGAGMGVPWRRSPSWLIMRVAIQSMVDKTDEFKAFMLYFMTSIPLLGDCMGISSDSLHCVGVKLARRLRKLSADAPGFGVVENEVSKAVDKITGIMGARWEELQARQRELSPWNPNLLDIPSDTRLSLDQSRDYICRRLSQGAHEAPSPPFVPTEFPRLIHTFRGLNGLTSANLSAALSKDPITALIDLEHFVASDLSQWAATRRLDESACVTLSRCIDVYATSASHYYETNPECESVKLLTILQMWVAFDQLATAQYPLLLDYSPEIPMNLLELLLLRDSYFVERLKEVQSYLSDRYNRACKGSIFQEAVNPTSFAVRYFHSSRELQALKAKIEADAEASQRKKREELHEKSKQYHLQIQKVQTMECDYYLSHGNRYHPGWCSKCKENAAAEDMRIEVHEWPLPRDDLDAQAAVFELKCPIVYQTWRTTTYTFLHDFCQPIRPLTDKVDPPVTLKDYSGLREYVGHISRVTYASPKISSSRHRLVSNATDTSICVENSLSLRLFDAGKSRWVFDSFKDCAGEELCTYVLPDGPYRTLQDALSKTIHSPNLAIVKQSEASPELTLHEHLAFSELRSGSRLQWLNIARELRAGILSFARSEVQMLIAQTAWQVGPISLLGALEWHTQLECSQFCAALTTEAEHLLSKMEQNWGHAVTLQTIILLLSRVLQFATEESVICHACQVLRHGREVALDWIKRICKPLDDAESETVIDDLRRHICALAATCRATFDIDPSHLGHLLSSDSDVKELVYCLILIHDNTPANNPPSDLRRLLARDSRLSHSSLSFLWDIVQRSRKGLDDAILEIWSEYRCGTDWVRLPQPNDRWITTTTTASGSSSKSTVRLNLLDGTLLINGTSLRRLPSSIVQHATYKRVLGTRILDIIHSNMPGMDFATRNAISSSGFHLHFKLEAPANNLIIQAKKDCEVYELIPHKTFDQDFPISFVQEYVHWLRLSPPPPDAGIQEIDFRPMQTKWTPSPVNWRMKFSKIRGTSTMKQGNTLLIDIRSPTFNMISTRLKPLESLGHIHITTTASDRVDLLVSLPRYKLSFFLNLSHQLESTNFREMIVDADQFTGTMVGLTSQLVLIQEKFANSCLIPARSVIIPFGPIRPEESLSTHHVATRVEVPNSSPSVRYFKYDIDTDLGRLIGTTFLSDLFKIYLHASTAYPMPDPLTGRTGTEEALSELNSARCLSFQTLMKEEYNVLCNIASLVPVQKQHSYHVQSLNWHGVGPLAQHWGFRTLVQTILEFHERLGIFSKDTKPLRVPGYNRHLQERLACRNYHLYAAEYAFVQLNPSHDAKYPRLDQRGQGSPAPSPTAVQLSANVSALVRQWPQRLSTVSDLWQWMKSFEGKLRLSRSRDSSLSFSKEFLKPSLADIWLSLYDRCRGSDEQEGKRYQLLFTLAAFAYQSPGAHELLPTILAFATIPAFRTLQCPGWDSYDLDLGIAPDERRLLELLMRGAIPLADSPSNNLTRFINETESAFQRRCEEAHVVAYTLQAKNFVKDIATRWLEEPSEEPSWTSYDLPLINLSYDLKGKINELFIECYKNWQLHNHIQEVQRVLDEVRSDSSLKVPHIVNEYVSPILPPVARPLYCVPDLPSLVKQNLPSSLYLPPPPRLLPPSSGDLASFADRSETSDLQSIVHKFYDDACAVRRHYGRILEKSLLSQKNEQLKQLEIYCIECGDHFRRTLGLITEASSPIYLGERVGHSVGQWPRVTIRTLLGMLSETSKSQLSEGWKSSIVFLAESMLRYQRARRLVRYYCLDAKDDFRKEYENDLEPGRDAPAEWLLIQIEGNFLLRSIQRRVAGEMIQPSSVANSLLQLNMGEGKSSVIVPIISSALADGNQLLRVVVLKPLAKQMFDLLVRRLSGLANRRIFYLPFSRGVGAPSAGKELQPLFDLCMRERGILLVQPEHILSFKLMGIDMAIREHKSSEGVTKAFLTSQSWLDLHSRDILDESDEILNVKYQLIYTSGRQEPLEDHPERWIRLQKILDCAKKHARLLRKMKPEALEVEPTRKGAFPIIRILDTDVGVELSERIAKDILAPIEQFRLLPGDVRREALEFVTRAKRDDKLDPSALDGCRGTELWKTLLHFRGVLGLGILQYALQKKRWRVDYGHDQTRTLLAVPYRAKDVPTLRADFGHPDIAVILTCLSYYYRGLKDDQLDLCFDLLFKLDNPSLEYEAWVTDCDQVPQSLIGINLDDFGQREKLRPLFCKNQAVINFYLSNVVFPKEAKQFTSRLSTSSWDLAERKGQVTTGFSGTNDNRDLLPTSIQQHDPVNQQGTNALVLGYVLRPENDHYVCLDVDGQAPSSVDFLQRMVEAYPPIQVLLDVGAQMLDMETNTIAFTWLSLASGIEAVVFFDDYDQLVVMTRDGSPEPLVSSPFNDKLDVCGIYLDDAHTRGTDLKLPTHFRAAVTLGPNLTKDRLVQGCMRMRKLGHGQSLMFLAPQEVDRAIRDLGKFDPSDPLRTSDIIYWAMLNTCDHIRHHLSHWAQQGVAYMKRREAWSAYASNPFASDAIDKLRSSWEEPDAQSLEDMYGSEPLKSQSHPAFDIPDLRDRLNELDVLLVGSAKVDEEQEREVSQELEREYQVKRPPPAQPAQHVVHDHVRQLVTHGAIDGATINNSPAFVQLFAPLRQLGEHEWSPSLWATKDFAATIDDAPWKATEYLRPVHWLLSLKKPKCLLVLSPYEVNELLPSIQDSKFVHLHMYAPRVTQAMKTFEGLDFFCIPPLPAAWSPPSPTNITQLNLFAGQLYLKDYDAYTHLRMTLGLVGDETEGQKEQWWESDGFVAPENRRGIMEEICKLSSSPLPFLKQLVSLRRKGLGYQSTHVGRILHGGLLTPEDFEKDIRYRKQRTRVRRRVEKDQKNDLV